jgi:hypothetical protein
MEPEHTKKVYLENKHIWIVRPGAIPVGRSAASLKNMEDVFAIPLPICPFRQLQWVRALLELPWLEREDILMFCKLAEESRPELTKESQKLEGP